MRSGLLAIEMLAPRGCICRFSHQLGSSEMSKAAKPIRVLSIYFGEMSCTSRRCLDGVYAGGEKQGYTDVTWGVVAPISLGARSVSSDSGHAMRRTPKARHFGAKTDLENRVCFTRHREMCV